MDESVTSGLRNDKMPNTQLHFSPPTGWMNDPNGLIFHQGKYHLFFQHNPFANEFGNISWGHAVSEDLQHWEHWPLALPASEGKMIYSGCVVYDESNSLAHPKGPALVALYTEHLYESEELYSQSIRIATSHDEGMTWDMSHPEKLTGPENDFRDPKVFWHKPSGKWVMVVALPKKYRVLFYTSLDLRHWQKTGEFTAAAPKGQFWECPDLFPLNDENGNERWVLTLSGANPDEQTWGMFYFTGDFDGKAFTPTNPPLVSPSGDAKELEDVKWLNYGHDFYAGITFEGTKERIMLAWTGNWAYAMQVPNQGWKSLMSLPRKLSLKNGKLVQSPITSEDIKVFDGPISEEKSFRFEVEGNRSIELLISPEQINLKREGTNLGGDKHKELSYSFAIEHAKVYAEEGILEVFLNGGEWVLTERF